MKPRILHEDILNGNIPEDMFENKEIKTPEPELSESIGADKLRNEVLEILGVKPPEDMILSSKYFTDELNEHGVWNNYERENCTIKNLSNYQTQLVTYFMSLGHEKQPEFNELKEYYKDFENVKKAGLPIYRYYEKAPKPKTEMEIMLYEGMVS